jgi:hypothetical protein
MLDEATRDIQDAKQELQGLDDVTRKADAGSRQADDGFTKLTNTLKAIGAVAAARKVAQVTVELAELGAQAERSERSFERIAGGSQRATIMLDQLQEATLYTRSEAQLMEDATNLMALGLADSAEGIADITRNVDALGGRFGGTMQQFQIMMSNDSLARVDSFGIGVEEATERIQELKDAGMDANEAFDTAILELMNEKYEKLDGTVEDNVTSVLQAKAAWADLKSELGRGFAPILGTMARGIAKVTREVNDQQSAINDYARIFGDAAASQAHYNSMMNRTRTIWGESRVGLDDIEGRLQAVSAETQRYTGLAERYAETNSVVARVQRDLANGTSDTAVAHDQYNQALMDSEAATSAFLDNQSKLRDSMQETASQGDRVRDAINRIRDALNDVPTRLEIEMLMKVRQERAGGREEFMDDITGGAYSRGFATGGFLPAGRTGVVGEGGQPEFMRATSSGVFITPLTGGGGGTVNNGGSVWNGDIVIPDAGSPGATAQRVIRELEDRGILRGARLR